MDIRKLTSRAELEAVFPVIKELRSHLGFGQFMELVEEAAKRDQYEIVSAFDGDKCVGAMGYRILFDLVHGKHLYIDDLVVIESYRSRGVGADLLRYAEGMAREFSCDGLRLCAGIENAAGKRFYEREGWTLRSVAYKKKI